MKNDIFIVGMKSFTKVLRSDLFRWVERRRTQGKLWYSWSNGDHLYLWCRSSVGGRLFLVQRKEAEAKAALWVNWKRWTVSRVMRRQFVHWLQRSRKHVHNYDNIIIVIIAKAKLINDEEVFFLSKFLRPFTLSLSSDGISFLFQLNTQADKKLFCIFSKK